MDDPTTDNPLTVDEAMALIGKWETHPGLLMAIFDASRKLRDEVERLRDQVCKLEVLKKNLLLNMESSQRALEKSFRDEHVMQTELEQLRSVVASNNQSISGIVLRWITPSRN